MQKTTDGLSITWHLGGNEEYVSIPLIPDSLRSTVLIKVNPKLEQYLLPRFLRFAREAKYVEGVTITREYQLVLSVKFNLNDKSPEAILAIQEMVGTTLFWRWFGVLFSRGHKEPLRPYEPNRKPIIDKNHTTAIWKLTSGDIHLHQTVGDYPTYSILADKATLPHLNVQCVSLLALSTVHSLTIQETSGQKMWQISVTPMSGTLILDQLIQYINYWCGFS